MIPSTLLMTYKYSSLSVRVPASVSSSFTYSAAGGAAESHLYDLSDTTPAADPTGLQSTTYLAYDLGAPFAVQKVRAITAPSFGFAASAVFKIQYSDTALTGPWTDSGSTITIGPGTAVESTAIVSAGEHRFWKLAFQSGTTGGNAWLGEVDFYAPGSSTGPIISSISPASGSTAGGTAVTITGANFTGSTGATIGGVALTSFTVVNDTTITGTTGADSAGTYDLVVQNPAGDATKTNAFTYAATPTVSSISPTTGTTAGGTSVTITGTNFTGATSAAVGGVNLTSFTVVNSTTITGVTGAHAGGAVNVTVTGPGGTGTLTNGFTYATAVQTPSAVDTTFTYTGQTPPAAQSNLYDGSDTTDAADPTGLQTTTHAAYDLGSAKTITQVRAVNSPRFVSSANIVYKIQYSDSGLTSGWNDAGATITMNTTLGSVSTASVSAGSHRYWRIIYQSGNISSNAWLGELQFKA